MKLQPLTIPQSLASQGDLVVIPRKEYEALQQHVYDALQPDGIPEFTPTVAEKRDLAKAREDFKKGKFISLYDLRRKLGVARTR